MHMGNLKAQSQCARAEGGFAVRGAVLPFGDTLHYPGCGCPASWKAHTRAADMVDQLARAGVDALLNGQLEPTRPLRVAYVLPHHKITGGMKMLVEHLRLLKLRGHTTVAVHRSDTAYRAMPPWTEVEATLDVVCKLCERLDDVFPVAELDVVVVGIFHQVPELLVGVPAPVLYWEQGHEWLFGDPVRFQTVHNYLAQDQLFHRCMHLPVALAAVSDAAAAVLGSQFGRAPVLLPNGVDCARFSPGVRSTRPPDAMLEPDPALDLDRVARLSGGIGGAALQERARSVLLVGNPALPLKGFDVALAVLAAVGRVLHLEVTWVCQVAPTPALLPSLAACGLRIRLHVSPPQDVLPELYRGHDALLFTSRYEAWGMPVLEAMAAGLPTVASACLGVQAFARHDVNALLADPQDMPGLARLLLAVLVDRPLAARLATAARETALRFSPTVIADRLEAVLYGLAARSAELVGLRHAAAHSIHFACAAATLACSKQQPQMQAPQPVDPSRSAHAHSELHEHVTRNRPRMAQPLQRESAAPASHPVSTSAGCAHAHASGDQNGCFVMGVPVGVQHPLSGSGGHPGQTSEDARHLLQHYSGLEARQWRDGSLGGGRGCPGLAPGLPGVWGTAAAAP